MEDGSELGELGSNVRSGMKREFAMLMKGQTEVGISVSPRRVTRAQNVAMSNEQRRVTRSRNVALNTGLRENLGGNVKIPSSEGKKRKKEAKKLEFGDEREEKIGAIEEDEPKSDVVNGYEEGKANVAKMGNQEDGVKVIIERQGAEAEKNDGVKSKIEMDSDAVKNVVEIETESNVINNIVKVIDDCEIVGIKVNGEGSGENRFSVKPFKRFTRSALKQKDDATEMSGTGDILVTEPMECDAVSPVTTSSKSNKVGLKNVMVKLMELLQTGLLEGLSVQYKAKGQSEFGLSGVMRGSGILCSCDTCNGNKVVSPNQFELHAGNKRVNVGNANKRMLECMYLENGNTLYDVLNLCKNGPLGPLDSLELAIQNAAGCLTAKRSIFCLKCKGALPETNIGKRMLHCDSCVVPKVSEHALKQGTDSDRSDICGSDTKSCEQIASSVRKCKSQGRITRKDIRLHKLVFEEDVLPDGTELNYYLHGKKLLEGYKKGAGIFCYCCESEVSASQFEAHAGCATRRKPYHNIFTSNGVSLHELSVKLSKERKGCAEENDDLCSICADGGDLICCDTCPRAFHAECVSLERVPQGTWYCRYCITLFEKQKFVEYNENAVAAGRIAGVDPLEQINQRCFRIVETLDADLCSCVLCRGNDFSKSGFGPRTVIICDQCENEYHIGCLQEHNIDNLKELPKEKWFCSVKCRGVHCALEKVVGEGEMKLPQSVLDIIIKKKQDLIDTDNDDVISWRLFRGKMVDENTRKFLSGAVTLLHERFNPIAVNNGSHLDLIPQMVYGRSYKDQDLGGMLTAILLVNSVVVSVGIFRIFGEELAELPLVATKSEYQGKGYFQCLFACMEKLLGSLDVRDLLLPAAEEAEALWINKFGFKKITKEEVKELRKDHQMMVFQGTAVLHKPVEKDNKN